MFAKDRGQNASVPREVDLNSFDDKLRTNMYQKQSYPYSIWVGAAQLLWFMQYALLGVLFTKT
jgi:hypothetical protein